MLFQANQELHLIEKFHVFRARANLVNFFRSQLLTFFGKVDPQLSLFIPDVDQYLDKRSVNSVYDFADIEKSLINVKKRFGEAPRKLPFIVILPGILEEKKIEFGSENFHFYNQEKDRAVFGSASETSVIFMIGTEDETSRIRISDMVYTAYTQFYRSNFIYKDPNDNTLYSILIKNDSVAMSTEGEVSVSDAENIYTVGIKIPISLEWQYSVDLKPGIHLDTMEVKQAVINDPNDNPQLPISKSEKEKRDLDTFESSIIRSFLFYHIDEVDYIGEIISKVNGTGDIIDPVSGGLYIIGLQLALFTSTGWEYTNPVEGMYVTNLQDDFNYIFIEGKWIKDVLRLTSS